MKPAAIYVRISKDGDGKGLGVKRQEEDCRALASRRSLDVGGVYLFKDNDISAVADRPEWNRLLRDIEDGRLGAVLAYSSSRLYRDVDVEKARLFKACMEQDQNGDRVQVETVVSGTIDPYTADGRMLANILASVDAAERERTGERLRRMMKGKKDRGEWIGRPPVGFKVVGKYLEPDERQQQMLREAVTRYIDGESINAIAKDLPAPTGSKLGRMPTAVLSRILHSTRIHEALPPDLSGSLEEALLARKWNRKGTSTPSLLGGILRCEICGGGMLHSSTRAGRSGQRWYSYRCPEPRHAGVSGPWVEEHISAAVLEAIDPKQIERRMKARQKNPQTAEVAAIEGRILKVEDMLGDGTLTKAAFVRQRDRLTAKVAALKEAEPDDAPDLPLEIARNLEAYWPEMTVVERRDVIRAVVRRIVVSKAAPRSNGRTPTEDRVRIDWR